MTWDGRGLPPLAQQRIARAISSRTATSLLSVSSGVAAGSVGLTPVGEVMGSAVQFLGAPGTGSCMRYRSGHLIDDPSYTPMSTGYQPLAKAIQSGYSTALGRLRQEAQALSADGVIDVRFSVTPVGPRAEEFVALGTAVHQTTTAGAARRPFFVTGLSGAAVSALVNAGWWPAATLVAVSILVRHADLPTQRQLASRAPNTEVTGLSELAMSTREDALNALSKQAYDCDGILLTSQQSRCWQREPAAGHYDHVAEARMFGTGVQRLRHHATSASAPLAMLHLSGATVGTGR